MMHIENKINIADAWEESIKLLLQYKHDNNYSVPTERGGKAIEIQNLAISIASPFSSPRMSDLHSAPNEFVEDYSMNIFDQSYHSQVYSRISELKKNGIIINQQEEIKKRLTSSWFSRRAIISIWDVYEDINSEHPPCICTLQYLIRNNRLCLTAYLRSNDAWLCTLLDMNAITLLQKDLADSLNLEIGGYTHFATSYHMYDYDIPTAERAFSMEGK